MSNQQLLSNQQIIVTAISIVLLLLIALIARIIQNQQRSQRLWSGLRNSLPAPLKVRLEAHQDGQLAFFEPAPEPFRKLEAQMQTAQRSPRIVLRGQLVKRPLEELLWQRGRPPDRALRRSIDAGLWELRRIDLVDGEFAVRGVNTAALDHSFFDLQARFGAFLQRVSVQAGDDFEVEIVVNANRFNNEDLPALLATLRGLGRAALR